MKINKKTNHAKTFMRGSIISLIGTGLLGLLNYLIRRKLSYSLSLTDFGFIYGALSLCSIFLAYIDIGLGQSAIILMSKAAEKKNKAQLNLYYLQYFMIKILAASVIFLIIAATYNFWVYDFLKYNNITPFFIILSMLFMQSILSAPSSVITALKKFGIFNIGQLMSPIIILIVILMLNPTQNINIYASAFPIAALVGFIFFFFSASLFGFYPTANSYNALIKLGPIFHLSKWIAISTLGLTTMYYMDSMMIIWLDGLKAVALYSIALPIMQIAQSLMVLPAVFIPIVSGMWQRKEVDQIGNACSIITEITIYGFWPILFSIIPASGYLITLLFPAKYIAASHALVFLFLGNIFFSLANFYMGTLNAGKYAKLVALTIIIASAGNLILNYLLIPYFSINGAAIATATSYILISVCLYFVLYNKLTTFKINFKSLLFPSIIGTICLILTFISTDIWNMSLLHAISFVILTNCVYFICSYKKIKYYYSLIMALIKS